MRVWQMNVEDPTSIRQLKVPIVSKPPSQDTAMETGGEEFGCVVTDVSSIPARPKRKQRNDSVSHNSVRAT